MKLFTSFLLWVVFLVVMAAVITIGLPLAWSLGWPWFVVLCVLMFAGALS